MTFSGIYYKALSLTFCYGNYREAVVFMETFSIIQIYVSAATSEQKIKHRSKQRETFLWTYQFHHIKTSIYKSWDSMNFFFQGSPANAAWATWSMMTKLIIFDLTNTRSYSRDRTFGPPNVTKLQLQTVMINDEGCWGLLFSTWSNRLVSHTWITLFLKTSIWQAWVKNIFTYIWK